MKVCDLYRGKVQCVLLKIYDIIVGIYTPHPTPVSLILKTTQFFQTSAEMLHYKMYIRHKSKMRDAFYKKIAPLSRFITFEVFLRQKFK